MNTEKFNYYLILKFYKTELIIVVVSKFLLNINKFMKICLLLIGLTFKIKFKSLCSQILR